MRRGRERGAVLLTVLLMVAVMSAVAVALMDEIRLAVRRTASAELTAQAQWYALGAEAFAVKLAGRAELARKMGAGGEAQAQLGRPMVLPIEGGRMLVTVIDASNCFNLNSLAGSAEDGAANPAGGQFRQLMRALGLFDGDQDRLAGAVADWVDPDTRPQSPGAEDEHYTRLDPPYRTANAPLTEVGELRAVAGFDAQTWRMLRPFVCAHPDTAPPQLNLNSLTLDQAPLLVMLAGKDLGLEAARQAIQARPEEGFANADAFWTLPVLAGRNPGDGVRAQTGVEPTYYELRVLVTLEGREVGLTSLVSVRGGRSPAVVARRFGMPE